MKGLIVNCEILYFATFRKPASTSLILTYPVPPFTTIRGLIANALGHPQHNYSLQNQIKLGLRVIHSGFKNNEMAKILKFKESPGHPIRGYPSSPMFREFIVNPEYQFFVAGDEPTMHEIHSALETPKRPLYLGQSDDLVEINVSEIIDVEEKKVEEFHTAVNGIQSDCLIEKVPYAFENDNGKYKVTYRLISIPKENAVTRLNDEGFIFDKLNVFLF